MLGLPQSKRLSWSCLVATSWASLAMAADAFRAAHCGEKIIPRDIVFNFGLSGVTLLTPTSAFHSISSRKTFCPRSKDPRAEPGRGGRYVDVSIAFGSF